ncbi:MAG: response regulator [Rhodocyclaceae bacterium]
MTIPTQSIPRSERRIRRLSFYTVVIATALLIGVLWAAGRQATFLYVTQNRLVTELLPRTRALEQLSRDYGRYLLRAQISVQTTRPLPLRADLNDLRQRIAQTESQLLQYRANQGASVPLFPDGVREAIAITDRVLDLHDRGEAADAAALLAVTMPTLQAAQDRIESEVDRTTREENALLSELQATRTHMLRKIALLFVMGGAVILALLYMLSRSVLRPLGQINRRTRTMASGDLTSPVPGTARHDEIGMTARALDSLRVVADKAAIRHQVGEKVSEIIEQLHGLDSLEVLAQRLLQFIAQTCSISKAVFYLRQRDGSLQSICACGDGAVADHYADMGENSLLTSAAQQRRIVCSADTAPESASASGELFVRYAMPVLSSGQLVAMVDVTSPKRQRVMLDALLHRLRKPLTLCMALLAQRIETRNALELSRLQASALADSQNELQMRQEHLLDLNRALTAKSDELAAAKESAERLANEKAEFASHVSHEIRTPMNAIIGLSHLALHECSCECGREREYLEKIHGASRHLLSVINGALDYCRAEAGRIDLRHEDFSIRALVDEVVETYRLSGPNTAVQLDSEIDANVPQRVNGDPVRIRQILVNYVANAQKFTTQGNIVVRVSFITPTTLRIEVSDTGPGISPESQERLFQPYSMLQSSGALPGTGLGLMISKRLAALMGGETGVSSIVGQGSRFWFSAQTAPVTVETLMRPAACATSADLPLFGSRLKGVSVLVVDDNALNQEVVEGLLARVGARVESLDDGLAALEHARGHQGACPYDAILMDIQMPGLDGIPAARALRSIEGWDATPIIALTADSGSSQQECLDVGMAGFVQKPFEPETLFQAIEAVTQASAKQPEAAHKPRLHIEGVDDRNGVGRYLGAAAYRRVLGEYIASHAAIAQDLIRTFVSQDYAQLARVTHKLKGVSAMVGAHELARAAQHLEDTCRAEPFVLDTCTAQHKHVVDSLHALVARIRAALSQPPEPLDARCCTTSCISS